MRNLVLTITAVFLMVGPMAWCADSYATAAPVQPAPLKVLFEVGTVIHDAEKQPALLKKVLEDTKQFQVTITTDRDQFKAPNIDKYDLVLIYTTGGDLTKEQEQGIVNFVKNGKGMVGIHSATDSFHNSDEFWKMIGGKFVGHNSGTFKVKITNKRSPITQGMSDFEITDETYRHEFHKDSKLITLMRRETDGEAVSWIQYYGNGRVFATGLGHGMEAWTNPSFQKMIINALLWAAGRLNP